MINPDRTETKSQPVTIPEKPKKKNHIPRWLSNPAFAIRTTLAVLTAAPGAVAAVDALDYLRSPAVVYSAGTPCNNTGLDYVGVGFVDDPFNEKRNLPVTLAKSDDSYAINIPNTLDYGDIWMGSPQFGKLVIEYAANPTDSNAKWVEVGRYPMTNNGTLSLARIKLDGLDANSSFNNTKPSVVIRTYFDNEKDKVKENLDVHPWANFDIIRQGVFGFYPFGIQGPAINRLEIPCGKTEMYWEGRLAADAELEKAVKNPDFIFRRWGFVFMEFMSSHIYDFSADPLILANFPKPSLFSDPKADWGPDNPAKISSQEDMRKAFQKYLDSRKQITPPPSYTPLSTPIPIDISRLTPTPVPTSTRTSAEKTATVEAERKITQDKAYNEERDKLNAEFYKTHPELAPKTSVPVVLAPEKLEKREGSIFDYWGYELIGAGILYMFFRRQKSKKGTNPPTGSSSSQSTGFSPSPGKSTGAVGGSSNPNTAPSAGSTRSADPLKEKLNNSEEENKRLKEELARAKAEKAAEAKIKHNQEWIRGMADFEKRWQAKNLPAGNDMHVVINRFKSMMDIIHETSSDNATLDPSAMGVRVRAGIETVIPAVWTGITCRQFLEKLYSPGFRMGDPSLPSEEGIAKMIYIPEKYRARTRFSDQEKEDIRRVYRVLMFALHKDVANKYRREADPDLEESIDILHTRFNNAWADYVKKLIEQKP